MIDLSVVPGLSLMTLPMLSWLERNTQGVDVETKERFRMFLQALATQLQAGGLCVELPVDAVKGLLDIRALFSDIGTTDNASFPTPFLWEALEGNRVRIYMSRFYACEASLAARIACFYQRKGEEGAEAARCRAQEIGFFMRHPTLCDMVFSQGLTVLYGGPGTGKTTQLAFILECLLAANSDLKVALAAPTGKAASRMKLALLDAIKHDAGSAKRSFAALAQKNAQQGLSGLPTATIHRWLICAQENGERPSKEKPLDCDLFVVDEASMVDIELAERLFSVLSPERTRVILMGDAYQLQAVGPGSFFADLCAFGRRKPYEFAYGLTQTHRFDVASPVGRFSTEIKQMMTRGETLIEDKPSEVKRAVGCAEPLPIQRPLETSDDVVSVARAWIAPYIDAYVRALKIGAPETLWKAYSDFRMLCAMRHGPVGVEALNALSQAMLRERLGCDYTEDSGIPIVILANDADRGVFNGDVGVILPRKTSENSMGRVYFGDLLNERREPLVIPLGLLPRYESAFAMTVHKAQGSEFHHVALFLPQDADSPLATSELLYTGITRVLDRKNDAYQIEAYGTLTLFATREVETKARSTRSLRSGGFLSRLEQCLGEKR